MSTKVKIIISTISVCVIIGVVVLGMVLVFTAPTFNIDASSIAIEYTAGKVSANVNIKREDVRLYHTDNQLDTTMTDIGAEHNFSCNTSSTSGVSGNMDLGMFNLGQFIDRTNADTTLSIDISLSATEASSDTFVKLNYTDLGEKDTNVRLVVKATMYNADEELDLGVTTYNLVNGVWNAENGVIFRANQALSKKIGDYYTGVKITCEAEVVSYNEDCRLDGAFKLSLSI